MTYNESGCSSDAALNATYKQVALAIRHILLHFLSDPPAAVWPQVAWANSHGHTLDGMIGDFCTDASLGIANFGGGSGLAQVSYGSTSTAFTNKDVYKYFSRTSNSNQAMAEGLAALAVHLQTGFDLLAFKIITINTL